MKDMDNLFVLAPSSEFVELAQERFRGMASVELSRSSPRLSLDKWQLYPFQSVSSTMDVGKFILKHEGQQFSGAIRCAGTLTGAAVDVYRLPAVIVGVEQTKGRGRDGKVWHSPPGGAYVSYVFSMPQENASLTAFSLACSVAVVRTVRAFGVQAVVKWPNDVLAQKKDVTGYRKLSGILVEILTSGERASGVIAGIGLNVADAQIPPEGGAISLTELAGKNFELMQAVVELTRNFICVVSEYLEHGFECLRQEWEQSSMMTGKMVRATVHGREVIGRVKGIADDGALILDDFGKEVIVISGSIELIGGEFVDAVSN